MKPGPKRQTTLPLSGWDSFFDPGVQSVLERHREPPAVELTDAERSELLAFALEAFEVVADLAGEVPNRTGRHRLFLELYGRDRVFMAELLATVSRFHETPAYEWPLARLVAHFSGATYADPRAVIRRPGDGKECEQTPALPELWSWEDLAGVIRDGLKLHRASATPDRIRAKEFFEERKRRLALLERWAPNFEAWRDRSARPRR